MMGEYSGFFPDVSGDREYTADFLARWVHSFIGNGVYDGNLAVTAGDHMQIILPAGQAWIDGYYYRNDGTLALPVANADGALNRKDTVVLRWDINARSITAQILTGTFASSPIAPPIMRDAERYDLKLAEISVPAGTTAITQALITDTRLNNDVCGIVHALIEQISTTTLYNQIQSDLAQFKSVNEADFTAWVANLTTLYNQIQSDLAQFKSVNEADFTAWFASLKEVLDENTAGNLLNLINNHIADQISHVQAGERAAWNAKSSKSITASLTLTAAGWTEDATNGWWTQTVSVAGVTAISPNEILPALDITEEQLMQFHAANIQDGGQAAGQITLKAWNFAPSVDIPVRVIVRGDL